MEVRQQDYFVRFDFLAIRAYYCILLSKLSCVGLYLSFIIISWPTFALLSLALCLQCVNVSISSLQTCCLHWVKQRRLHGAIKLNMHSIYYLLLFHDNIASVFLPLFVPCIFLSVRGVLVFTEACVTPCIFITPCSRRCLTHCDCVYVYVFAFTCFTNYPACVANKDKYTGITKTDPYFPKLL